MNNFELVENLNFKDKIERSLSIIDKAYKEFGEFLVVAHSLGKDSIVVWDLVKKINPNIKGFIVTTRFKPFETKEFMKKTIKKYPELKVYQNDEQQIEDGLYKVDPDKCCYLLKVIPTRNALLDLNAKCWITGLRCTEGHTRNDFKEEEYREENLKKVNPILLWTEREVWQYLALNKIDINPLYNEGFRSLGCEPCTKISNKAERSGRWIETSKCGGECGIHTQKLIEKKIDDSGGL